jgi:glycosyltransferase involved in cell wall biosynthesis
MDKSKISVITPSYNQGTFLETAIESVLKQNYPGLEYIVVDGGSSDSSINVIRKHERCLAHWVSEKDGGQTDALNKGLDRATGEIIGWLNSDDVYVGQCLHHAKEYFDRNPNIDIVFSDYFFIDEVGRVLKWRKEIPFHYGVYLWTEDCYHANCAGFFRKRVFDKVGKLDDRLAYGMDYEFYMRCANAGLTFGHVRDCWGAYRLHGKSKSVSRYEGMIKEGREIACRFQPRDVSPTGCQLRKHWYFLYRLARKFMLGSYYQATAFKGKSIQDVCSCSEK